MARKRTVSSGNGDECPIDPEHGAMLVLTTGRQYCPHRSHDGRSKSNPLGPAAATPALWPGGYQSFAAAVVAYHSGTTKAAVEPSALPTLDITLEV